MKYKFVGEGEVHVPSIGITVKKDEVFETPMPINNPDFVVVEDEAKSRSQAKREKVQEENN